jgi:hypothetical protein
MKRFTVYLTKEIVTDIEAESQDDAIEKAQEYDANGWDGLWLHAEPQIVAIEEAA